MSFERTPTRIMRDSLARAYKFAADHGRPASAAALDYLDTLDFLVRQNWTGPVPMAPKYVPNDQEEVIK